MPETRWTLVNHLTNALRRERVGDKKAPTLWPSQATAVLENENGEEVIVGKCRRARFFRYVSDLYHYDPEENNHWEELTRFLDERKAPVSDYMQWIWAIGNLYEEYVIQKSKESGVFIREQTPVYIKKHNVSGKMDVEVVDPQVRKLRVIEVKSVYGYGANMVIGTGAKKPKTAPAPKEGNLMQLALYDWWWVMPRSEQYARSRLLYGARDDGKNAEIEVWCEVEEIDGTPVHWICYQYIEPDTLPADMREPVKTPICIENILEQYDKTTEAVETRTIPKRDFKLKYTEADCKKLYDKGELNRADTAAWEKRVQRIEDGKEPTKLPSVSEKGDWQCRFCDYRHACYSKTNPWQENEVPGE